MLSYMQKIGRSLMIPVAVLPAAALLSGIGYWIDPSGTGTSSVATILTLAGGAILSQMGLLFAVGLAFGLSEDEHGAAALAGLVGWIVVQTLLAPDSIAALGQTDVANVSVAFENINNTFIGIVVGIMAAQIYNHTHKVNLPKALSFFSGRRLGAIATAAGAVLLSVVFFFIWPVLNDALTSFGLFMTDLGAVGAGLFGFFNRLLLPLGLHHVLNQVFWTNLAGINDIPNYLSGDGVAGVTGIYQAGFFPIMMFGLPAGALAIYHEALPSQKKFVGGLMLSGALASFFTGVTEPLEFSFMFVAPVLYVMHAVFTGLSLFIAAKMQWIAGFGFSAGFVDYILSFKNPLAINNLMLLVQGAFFAFLYYFSFRFMIRKFNFKTPGRTEGEFDNQEENSNLSASEKHLDTARKILNAIGVDNLEVISNCTTRLRLTVKDSHSIKDEDLKSVNLLGIVRPNDTSIQLIVGPDVEFVADALKLVYNENKK